jgi:NADP-dependent 3-hydroxy acid dehydrogenase YdfG
MSTALANKWVVITGASSGFGAAAARQFGALGAKVLLGARREDRLKQAAADARKAGAPAAEYHRLDVSSTESVEAFVGWVKTHTGAVDVLLNNAGGAKGADKLADAKDADWEFMMQTNVLGLLRMTRAVLPLMVKNPGSNIVNIGSIAGRLAYEGGSAYCAAKSAELAITNALRLEINGSGVRVTSVDPGFAETEFALVRFHGDESKAKKVYEGMTPLTADDVAEAIVWVATRPAHVCIDEMVIKPTDQAAVYKIHRRTASK